MSAHTTVHTIGTHSAISGNAFQKPITSGRSRPVGGLKRRSLFTAAASKPRQLGGGWLNRLRDTEPCCAYCRPLQRELQMKNQVLTLAAAVAFAVSVALTVNVASAMPFAYSLAIKKAAPSGVDTVRWVRRRWVGRFRYNCNLSGPYYPYGYACGPNYRYGW
jgi:hypothetical protein